MGISILWRRKITGIKPAVSDLVYRIEGYSDTRFEVLSINKEGDNWVIEVKENKEEENG